MNFNLLNYLRVLINGGLTVAGTTTTQRKVTHPGKGRCFYFEDGFWGLVVKPTIALEFFHHIPLHFLNQFLQY